MKTGYHLWNFEGPAIDPSPKCLRNQLAGVGDRPVVVGSLQLHFEPFPLVVHRHRRYCQHLRHPHLHHHSLASHCRRRPRRRRRRPRRRFCSFLLRYRPLP